MQSRGYGVKKTDCPNWIFLKAAQRQEELTSEQLFSH